MAAHNHVALLLFPGLQPRGVVRGIGLAAGEDAVAIDGVDLAEAGPPAGLFCGDQGRAGTAEPIEHDLAPVDR